MATIVSNNAPDIQDVYLPIILKYGGACALYPVIVPVSLLSGGQVGTEVEIPIAQDWADVKLGKLSFIYWNPTQPPQLAVTLQNPGNTKNYKNPDNLNDEKISQLDWVAAYPGEHEAEARIILEGLIDQTIWAPVWYDLSCAGGLPCNGARIKSTPTIEMFTFAQLKLTAVDYVSNPATLTFAFIRNSSSLLYRVAT